MDIFCPKLMNCDESIKVIAEILSKNSKVKSDEIENKFKSLGLFKVKDLAGATLKTVSTLNIGNDSIAEVYKAIEIYDACFADQLKLALSEFNQENFIKTQEICHNMISRKPDDITFLNILAATYYKCGEYEKSLEYYQKAHAQNSKCSEVLNNIGSVYWKKSQYDKACHYYYLAWQNSSNNLKAWINYAGALFATNDLMRAEIAYKTILKKHPKLYKVRNICGNLLLSINKTNEAKEQYKYAMNDGPEFPGTFNNLGNVYILTGKIEKAILHYKKSLELNPYLVNALINLGVAYSKSNNYQNAIQSFQQVLQLCPDNILAMKNIATVYEHKLKLMPMAVEYYKKCLELIPNNYNLNLKLGFLYGSNLKNHEKSEAYFKKCIDLCPQEDFAYKYLIFFYEEWKNKELAAEYLLKLGDLYLDKCDVTNAYASYHYSLLVDPENPYGHWKLGHIMYKADKLDLALLRYRKAIELKINFSDAYFNCALVYESKNLTQKAIMHYNAVLNYQPDHKNALLNVINLEFNLGNFDNAAKLFEKFNKSDNSSEEAFNFHIKLANVFYKGKRSFDKAIYHYRKALCFFNQATQLNPQCVIAYTNIGSIFEGNKNFTEAIQAYKFALNIEPDFPEAYCNLVQCLQHICDWSDFDLRIAKLKDIVHQQLDNNLVPSLLPHHSLLYSFSPEVIKKIASKYAEQCVENALVTKQLHKYEYQISVNLFVNDGLIRVGYVISDYSNHPASLLMELIPRFIDKNNIEVFCYSLSANDDSSFRSNVCSKLVHYKNISDQNVIEVADSINEDGIHILVNTNGYTNGARNEIFALRPAPIQVLWLGYPTTSGSTFIDYLITDEICSPPELKDFYTEKLVYMESTVFIGNHKEIFSDLQPCVTKTKIDNMNTNNVSTLLPMNNGNMDFDKSSNDSMLIDSITQNIYSINILNDSQQCCTRQLYNIPEDAVVYCNFSQLYKIDPSTFKMWATILHYVPNSVLWLLRFSADGEVNLRKYAAELDIDQSRMIFSNLEPKHEHMKRIQLADVFLDTIYNGHLTCLDAIWAGIPVVTLPKEMFASRVTASQLTSLGDTFTIAKNENHYIEIAVQLGTDKKLLESLRQRILSLKFNSKLFDCQSYAETLMTVYKNMWNFFLSDYETM